MLGEGRPESLDGDELVIKFPAGYSFQANQVARGDNPQVIAEALREVTGRQLRDHHQAGDRSPRPSRQPGGRC